MSEHATLTDQLLSEPTRPRVVAECVTLIDKQVKAKTGLRGVALKGAYGVIKTIKRGFVANVVDARVLEHQLTVYDQREKFAEA